MLHMSENVCEGNNNSGNYKIPSVCYIYCSYVYMCVVYCVAKKCQRFNKCAHLKQPNKVAHEKWPEWIGNPPYVCTLLLGIINKLGWKETLKKLQRPTTTTIPENKI